MAGCPQSLQNSGKGWVGGKEPPTPTVSSHPPDTAGHCHPRSGLWNLPAHRTGRICGSKGPAGRGWLLQGTLRMPAVHILLLVLPDACGRGRPGLPPRSHLEEAWQGGTKLPLSSPCTPPPPADTSTGLEEGQGCWTQRP